MCCCCSFHLGEKQLHTRDSASPSSSSVLFPAPAWCSDSPQQGVSSEEWIISQAYAKEQTQTQEDGAVNQQCQNLAHLSLCAGFPVIGWQDCVPSFPVLAFTLKKEERWPILGMRSAPQHLMVHAHWLRSGFTLSLFLFCFSFYYFKTRFLCVACRPGLPQTQRSSCFCLPSSGINSMCHLCPDTVSAFKHVLPVHFFKRSIQKRVTC